MTEPTDWNTSWGDNPTPYSPRFNVANNNNNPNRGGGHPQYPNPRQSSSPSNNNNNSAYSQYNTNWNSPEQHQQQQQSFSMPFGVAGQINPQQQQHYPNLQQQNNIYQNSLTPPNFQMFPEQLMNEPILNTAHFAAHVGGQFAEQQKEKFTKYLTSFNLKYYFAVDTSYVSRKLGILFFPFIHRDWTNKIGQNSEPLPAKSDINAPDLYIPLMAFITYTLVAGFVFGIQKRFSPEKLGILTTNALFYLFLENILVFVTKYVLNISQTLNIWQALSYSSYKFVGMTFCLLLYLVGGANVYYIGLAYCIFSTVFFLLRSLKTFFLDVTGYNNNDGGRKRKVYLLLSITLIQSLIMWLLTSSVTTYMPDEYDFAKMAFSGISGYSNNNNNNNNKNLPMQDNGEVDYEALLKMP